MPYNLSTGSSRHALLRYARLRWKYHEYMSLDGQIGRIKYM